MKKLIFILMALGCIGWTSYSVNDNGKLRIITLDETQTTIEKEMKKMGIDEPYFKTENTPSRADRDFWVMDSSGKITVDETAKEKAESEKAIEELQKPEAQIEVLKQENADLKKRIEELEYDVTTVKEDIVKSATEKII